MKPRNHTGLLLLGCAMALWSATPRLAHAAATASVFSSTNSVLSDNDFDSVLIGGATAGISGSHTNGGVTHSFNANVTANGDNGTIRAAISDVTVGTGSQATSLAEGIIFDTLRFIGPGSTNVRLSFSMLGSFRNTGGSSSLTATMQLVVVGRADLTASAFWTDNGPSSLVIYAGSIPGGPDEVLLPTQTLDRSPANVHATINENISISSGDTVVVRGRLRVTGNAGTDSITNGQFDHTAQMALTLPQGWSFTSESGTFLSVSPVPEPSSCVLLALGCGALLARRRRGRTTKV